MYQPFTTHPSHFPPKFPYFSHTFYTFAFFNQNKKQLNERRITQMKELKKRSISTVTSREACRINLIHRR